MGGTLWTISLLAVFTFANGQNYGAYGGYQYTPQYPPYYKMAPVYSWYQRDSKPTPAVEMEPKSQDITPFEVQGLLYHNLHRKVHDTPDIRLDHELSLQAARYAQQIAQRLSVKHSPISSRPGQAENIFLRCKAFSTGVSAFEAVREWYSTVCHWDFDKPIPVNEKGRPFSKIVWRTNQQLGIGRANFPVDKFNCTAVVARYRPYLNEQNYIENVPKGKFVPTGCRYINAVDNDQFIVNPEPGDGCQKISGFKGQMLHESSSCTIKKLFAIFGASVRRGKQGFSVVL